MTKWIDYLNLAMQIDSVVEAAKNLAANVPQQLPVLRTRLFKRMARLTITLQFEE